MILEEYKNPSVFDDMQGSRVFTFAAGFGLALLLVYGYIKPTPSKLL